MIAFGKIFGKIMCNKKIKNHFIIGDFKINLLKIDDYSNELLNNCYSAGYFPCIELSPDKMREKGLVPIKGEFYDNNIFQKSSIFCIILKYVYKLLLSAEQVSKLKDK